MNDGDFIRFGEEGAPGHDRLPLLHRMYEFESTRIPIAHGGRISHVQLRWRLEDFQSFVGEEYWGLHAEAVHDVIEWMVEHRFMLRYTDQHEQVWHTSRTGESIRVMSNAPSFNRAQQGSITHPPSVSGTTWVPLLRRTPSFEHDHEDLCNALSEAMNGRRIGLHGGDEWPLEAAFAPLRMVMDAVAQAKEIEELRLSSFQRDGIVSILVNAWTGGSSAGIITAGTGVGKTMVFMIPAMLNALIRRMQGFNRVGQVFLYPRVALAGDQFDELHRYISRLNERLVDLGRPEHCLGAAFDAGSQIGGNAESVHRRYGHYPGTDLPWMQAALDLPAGRTWSAINAVNHVYAGENPAHLVVTNDESFRNRLFAPAIASTPSALSGVDSFVMDEIHLSTHVTAGHHTWLLQRIQALLPHSTFIGVSATIARPQLHLANLWFNDPLRQDEVFHVPCPDGGDPMGIHHHVLFKPNRRSSLVGTASNMVSLGVHHRRNHGQHTTDREALGAEDLDAEVVERFSEHPKTIAFADSHGIVSRWTNLLLDNEVTTQRGRMDDEKPYERTPYSTWLHTPLARGNPNEEGCAQVCASCRGSNYSEPVVLPINLTTRFEHGDEGNPLARAFSHPPNHANQLEVSGLDTCPHLLWGTCWWFSDHGMEENGHAPLSGPRPGDEQHRSWRDSLRIRRETSATRGNPPTVDGLPRFTADLSYRGRSWEAYPGGPQEPWVGYDVVAATPTLEVGVDMNNVTEVFTHKAIRNISSYRQKIGRAGRERGSDVLLGTTLSQSSLDLRHLRSPANLVLNEIRDTIPTAPRNTAVLCSQLYATALSIASRNASSMLILRNPWTDVQQGFQTAIDSLAPAGHVFNQVRYMFREFASDEQIEQAIDALRGHLDLFMQEIEVEGEMWTVARWLTDLQPVGDGQFVFREEILPGGLNAVENVRNGLRAAGMADNDFNHLLNNPDALREFVNNNVDPNHPIRAGILHMIDQLPVLPTIIAEVRRRQHGNTAIVPARDTRWLHMLLKSLRCTQNEVFSLKTSFFTEGLVTDNVVVQNLDNHRTSELTGREALRFALPGMWTSRIAGLDTRGVQFVRHTQNGALAYNPEDGAYIHQMEQATYGTHFQQSVMDDLEPHSLPVLNLLGLDATQTYHAHNILRLDVVSDGGYGTNPASSQAGISDFPDTAGLAAMTDLPAYDCTTQQGFTSKLRPTAYPILAALSEPNPEGAERVLSFIELEEAHHGLDVNHPQPGVQAVDHPAFAGLFSSIELLPSTRVREYAFGVERNNEVRILPRTGNHRIVYTQSMQTEALRFTLQTDVVDSLAEAAVTEHVRFDESTLRFLGHELLTAQNSIRSAFHVESFLDLCAARVWDLSGGQWPESARDGLHAVLNGINYNLQQHQTKSRAEGADILTQQEQEDMMQTFAAATELWIAGGLHDAFDERYLEWTKQSIVHGLSGLLKQCAASYSGLDSVGMGYVVHQAEGAWHIDVYDAAHGGNGSSRMVATYMHLTDLERDVAARAQIEHLPTRSFADYVEANYSLCPEHVMSEIATQGADVPHSLHQDIGDDVEAFRTRAEAIWEELDIADARDAELHLRRRWADVEPGNFDEAVRLMLERELALDVCGVECDACRLSDESIHPTHIARFLTVRSHLDVALSSAVFDLEGGSYLRQQADSAEIQDLAGTAVAGVPQLEIPEIPFIGHHVYGFSRILHRVIHRFHTPEEDVDWYVRVRDVQPQEG